MTTPNSKLLLPLYSIPHFSFTMTGLPVRPFKNGFGLTGTVCRRATKISLCA